ncbi:unnamed protein product, partial [Sphacelaria rigidula]
KDTPTTAWATEMIDTAAGWTLLLSTSVGASAAIPRGEPMMQRNARSLLWLKSHDASTIDDLLGSALRGTDKKSQLAATRTLLAAADAIAEKTERKNWPSCDQPMQEAAQQKRAMPPPNITTTSTVLPNLGAALAEKFVPLLTVIAVGKVPHDELGRQKAHETAPASSPQHEHEVASLPETSGGTEANGHEANGHVDTGQISNGLAGNARMVASPKSSGYKTNGSEAQPPEKSGPFAIGETPAVRS